MYNSAGLGENSLQCTGLGFNHICSPSDFRHRLPLHVAKKPEVGSDCRLHFLFY